MSSTVPALRPAAVTVVRSASCHLCEDALTALAELGTAYPLSVETVEAMDPRGVALVREHRVPIYPLVLVDGVFFSFGRLPRKKLVRLLAGRAGQVA